MSHEFFLISSDFELNDKYMWYRNNRYIWTEKIVISDDIIHHMVDFLNWMPSYNPETKESGNGINYYGVTVINKLGAEKLIKIVNAWLKLIDAAPDTFSLRGHTIWKEEENGEGYWERTSNRINRNKVQSELEQLIGLAAKASHNNQLIIHFGI